MDVTEHDTVSAAVLDALTALLPAGELPASLVADATSVTLVRDGGRVAGAAVVAEGRPTLSEAPVVVGCAGSDEATHGALAAPVVVALRRVPSVEVGGPWEVAFPVALLAAAGTGRRVSSVMNQRLMVATDVLLPRTVRGAARRMVDADLDVVTRWLDAFAVEALGATARGPAAWRDALERPGWGVWVWEVDGRPVALVNSRRSTRVSSRLGPVYTPRSERRHGFAAALTAAVTRACLDAGDERVTLYTDVTNATSNHVYARVGFRDLGPHGAWVIR